MTATSHALIGTMIAAKFGNPALALSFSFLSHFAADLVPHWDLATHWRNKSKGKLRMEAIVDVLLGFVLSLILYSLLVDIEATTTADFVLIFAAIIVSQAPDWLTAPHLMLGKGFPISDFMYQIQHKLNNKLDKPWGIVTQVLALIILYLILFVLI